MKIKWILLLLVINNCTRKNDAIGIFFRKVNKNSDADRTIQEIVESRGFLFEEHKVTTTDGYILTIHRVINPTLDELSKQPVLLQHGFTGCSVHWLIAAGDGYLNDPEYDKDGKRKVSSNLGFALAKYRDVWLGNFRGNRYSLQHETLLTNDPKFWDFSFDEFIADDLPSTIDYILNETGRKSLAYVGHSQGTLTMFGLLASQPKYNQIVKPFIALAPIVRINHMRSPFKYFLPFLYPITSSLTGRVASSSFVKSLIAGHLFDHPAQRMTHTLFFLFGGFDWSQVDSSRLPVYHSHPFGDVSFKNLNHLIQMYIDGKFCKFNYDESIADIYSSPNSCDPVEQSNESSEETNSKNLVLYKSKSPPVYDIKLITNKYISLFHGANDWFTSDEDLDFIRKELKVTLYQDHRIPYEGWNHLDFILGKDCGHFVNAKVIDLIEKTAKNN